MTGVRMPSQETPQHPRVYKVNTPRVGVDGLREVLEARYGKRGGGSSENTATIEIGNIPDGHVIVGYFAQVKVLDKDGKAYYAMRARTSTTWSATAWPWTSPT